MSTNMTPIDEGFIQYPVPGIDNDSQGFRDRYAILRNNLNTAREEISLLNTNTAKVNTNNNFGGNKIIDANISNSTVEANRAEDGAAVEDDTLSISYAGGSVHVVRVGNSVNPLTLSFTDWPTETANNGSRFAKLTVILNPADGEFSEDPLQGSRTIVWPSNVKINFNIAESNISVPATKIFEVFTYDAGTTLFVNYLGLYE